VTKSVAEGLAAYASDADLRAAKVRMGAAMPDDGWLHDYLRAVTPLTDAPVEFHLVSGLCALAAAVGNRLWTVSWGQSVYPHLWVVLVAPSSFWRKSTSINQAEALLREASPTSVYPSDFSREKFLRILAEQPGGVLTLKEFGGFLATLGRDYMGGMKENLTELYDGPDVFTRALQRAPSRSSGRPSPCSARRRSTGSRAASPRATCRAGSWPASCSSRPVRRRARRA
jgi:hypothetical protein